MPRPNPFRIVRSIMYVPASEQRVLDKTLTLPHCDAFIYDLEDAVSVEFKEKARENLRRMGNENRLPVNAVIRINGIDTEYFERDCAVAKFASAVLVPKAETLEQLSRVRELVGGGPKVWSMIETPRGVLNAHVLAKHSQALVMGTVDLGMELRADTDPKLGRFNLMTSLQLTVLAARAEKILALDGVYIHLNDQDGFTKECVQGRQLGFDGKTLIHPSTIDEANRVYSPSENAVAWCKRVVTEYEKSEKKGAIKIDGKLVELLHYNDAKRMLEFKALIDAKNKVAPESRVVVVVANSNEGKKAVPGDVKN